MDRYRGFQELEQHETRGKDYRVHMRKGPSGIAVMAPHGGAIEFGTDLMAQAIAYPDHTFWTFMGIKKNGNNVLHITSTRFDAPDALKIALSAQTVITLHGCRGHEPLVHVGGRDVPLKVSLCRALLGAGFNARISTTPGLTGQNPLNLCNRCRTGRGVQLEVTKGLRKRLFTRDSDRGIRVREQDFLIFTAAVRSALIPKKVNGPVI